MGSNNNAKVRRELEKEDIRKIMNSAEGVRFIKRVMARTHYFEQSFTGEAMGTSFNEGSRSIGLFISSEVFTACPQHYTKLLEQEKVNVTTSGTDYAD